jgi:uncharacterized protein (DUF2336 family)
MIVRHFLQWARTAPAAERADATGALARAYLYSDLSPDDRIAAEGAMVMSLDDPSPLVRRALAQALAASADAPPAVIFALAGDQPEIASLVFERSPLLLDADLVELVAAGEEANQAAIARRAGLPRSVAAAIAEVGTVEACLVLTRNPAAEFAAFSLRRVAERFGHLPVVREALFAREDLPAETRQTLMIQLSQTLVSFVAERRWLEEARARRISREACEKATVTLAAASPARELGPLVRHLRESGQLNAGLMLRMLLCGNLALLEQALAELSGLPPARVAALLHDRRGAGARALCERAGLPESTLPAFTAAIEALHERGFIGDVGGPAQLKRRMIERVLTRYGEAVATEIDPILTLLRRFATEAAREEARLFCQELAAA